MLQIHQLSLIKKDEVFQWDFVPGTGRFFNVFFCEDKYPAKELSLGLLELLNPQTACSLIRCEFSFHGRDYLLKNTKESVSFHLKTNDIYKELDEKTELFEILKMAFQITSNKIVIHKNKLHSYNDSGAEFDEFSSATKNMDISLKSLRGFLGQKNEILSNSSLFKMIFSLKRLKEETKILEKTATYYKCLKKPASVDDKEILLCEKELELIRHMRDQFLKNNHFADYFEKIKTIQSLKKTKEGLRKKLKLEADVFLTSKNQLDLLQTKMNYDFNGAFLKTLEQELRRVDEFLSKIVQSVYKNIELIQEENQGLLSYVSRQSENIKGLKSILEDLAIELESGSFFRRLSKTKKEHLDQAIARFQQEILSLEKLKGSLEGSFDNLSKENNHINTKRKEWQGILELAKQKEHSIVENWKSLSKELQFPIENSLEDLRLTLEWFLELEKTSTDLDLIQKDVIERRKSLFKLRSLLEEWAILTKSQKDTASLDQRMILIHVEGILRYEENKKKHLERLLQERSVTHWLFSWEKQLSFDSLELSKKWQKVFLKYKSLYFPIRDERLFGLLKEFEFFLHLHNKTKKLFQDSVCETQKTAGFDGVQVHRFEDSSDHYQREFLLFLRGLKSEFPRLFLVTSEKLSQILKDTSLGKITFQKKSTTINQVDHKAPNTSKQHMLTTAATKDQQRAFELKENAQRTLEILTRSSF